MESCLKKAEPEAYKALTKGIISFSRGWMKIHNQESEWVVTDALTPQEFAIAMLACRDWRIRRSQTVWAFRSTL